MLIPVKRVWIDWSSVRKYFQGYGSYAVLYLSAANILTAITSLCRRYSSITARCLPLIYLRVVSLPPQTCFYLTMTAYVRVINVELGVFQAGGPVKACFRRAALTAPLRCRFCLLRVFSAGDPVLPHLERFPAVPALHVHSGAAQPRHLWAHLPAVRVASGGGGTEL